MFSTKIRTVIVILVATFAVAVATGTAEAEQRSYESKTDYCARLKQEHDDAVQRMKDYAGRPESIQAAHDDARIQREAKDAGCKWAKGSIAMVHAANPGTRPDQPLTAADGTAASGGGAPYSGPSFVTQD